MSSFIDSVDAFAEAIDRKAYLWGSPEVLELCGNTQQILALQGADFSGVLAVRTAPNANALATAMQGLVVQMQDCYADADESNKGLLAFAIATMSYDPENAALATSWISQAVTSLEKEAARLKALAFAYQADYSESALVTLSGLGITTALWAFPPAAILGMVFVIAGGVGLVYDAAGVHASEKKEPNVVVNERFKAEYDLLNKQLVVVKGILPKLLA